MVGSLPNGSHWLPLVAILNPVLRLGFEETKLFKKLPQEVRDDGCRRLVVRRSRSPRCATALLTIHPSTHPPNRYLVLLAHRPRSFVPPASWSRWFSVSRTHTTLISILGACYNSWSRSIRTFASCLRRDLWLYRPKHVATSRCHRRQLSSRSRATLCWDHCRVTKFLSYVVIDSIGEHSCLTETWLWL